MKQRASLYDLAVLYRQASICQRDLDYHHVCRSCCLIGLPISQYPNITPPQILVSATYVGADAYTVSENVAAPLEQQINGVENMIYMYSQNSADGQMALSVFFDIGTDPDMAQVNVQNRVNLATPACPKKCVASV